MPHARTLVLPTYSDEGTHVHTLRGHIPAHSDEGTHAHTHMCIPSVTETTCDISEFSTGRKSSVSWVKETSGNGRGPHGDRDGDREAAPDKGGEQSKQAGVI